MLLRLVVIIVMLLLFVCDTLPDIAQSHRVGAKQADDRIAPLGGNASQGELINVRGHRLYVEVLGPKDAPPLLYLHGGPGTGSYDFGLYQGKNLSRSVRLILMDQRGVLRSDPIGKDEPFGLDDIIEDAEAIREHLGIKQWAVLGHSSGGYLAVRYAVLHPTSIKKLVLESPTFDLALSTRSTLRGMAGIFQTLGKTVEASEALKLVNDTQMPTGKLWQDFVKLFGPLGDKRNDLYVHGANKNFFEQLVAKSGIPVGMWGRAATHQNKLFSEGKIFESLLSYLTEIQCPVLLVKGKYDYVTTDEQVRVFKQKVKHGKVIIFKNSSHFPRVEEPEKYAMIVTKFVR